MSGEIRLDFDCATQSLPALQAAAYRLIGTAHCDISVMDGRYHCCLNLIRSVGSETVRVHFLDCVTDENVRASLRERTDSIRNVILSLAFGSLAAAPRDPS